MSENLKHRPPRRSGLEDVARLAEVSLATVDRVLNERGSVAADTARRVIEIARQVGLRRTLPAPYARRLRLDVLLARSDDAILGPHDAGLRSDRRYASTGRFLGQHGRTRFDLCVGRDQSAHRAPPRVLMFRCSVLALAVGGASVTVPVYLAEISPTERRGGLVTRNELVIVSGRFLAFCANALIGNLWGDAGPHSSGIWRLMLVIAALPAVALWVGMLTMPESPRWLASKERFADALTFCGRSVPGHGPRRRWPRWRRWRRKTTRPRPAGGPI